MMQLAPGYQQFHADCTEMNIQHHENDPLVLMEVESTLISDNEESIVSVDSSLDEWDTPTSTQHIQELVEPQPKPQQGYDANKMDKDGVPHTIDLNRPGQMPLTKLGTNQ